MLHLTYLMLSGLSVPAARSSEAGVAATLQYPRYWNHAAMIADMIDARAVKIVLKPHVIIPSVPPKPCRLRALAGRARVLQRIQIMVSTRIQAAATTAKIKAAGEMTAMDLPLLQR
jgi:hypothetical protein